MTVHQAATRWRRRQAKLLGDAYQQGWRTGVQNYRSQYATPPTSTRSTTPLKPNTATQARVLAPAMQSLTRMLAQLVAVAPTAAQVAAAGGAAAAVALAAREYLASNAWLLAAGSYVLWAAEQAGYAEAANADGLLLTWQLDKRSEHCADCPQLAALPPMALDQWPTLPGEGATACKQGCKCSLASAPASERRALTGAEEELLARIGARQPVLVAA